MNDEAGGAAGAAAPLRGEDDILFPRLDRAQMAIMEAAGRSLPLEQGQVLFSPGDLDYDFIVVSTGCVEIVDDYGSDEARVLTRYGARQFVGELNLITAEPSLLTARVAEAGTAIFVTREALRGVISRDPRLGDEIVNALIGRRAMIIEVEGGARLIGSGSDPATRDLREFLTRNRVPHRFIDLDGSDLAPADDEGGVFSSDELPVLFTGKDTLRSPTILAAATALNLRAPNKTTRVAWDCLIVGGGPAGLGAAVYAATEGLSTIMIDAVALGGQASTSSRIENYLGFPAGISGSDLAGRAIAQARRFGLRTAVPERALSLGRDGERYVVALDSGDELAARSVVLATGAAYRILPVEGIQELNGRGVYYAATLVEARMCGTKSVGVVGGGNSAGQAAVFLSSTAEKVQLLLRGGDLGASMSRYLVDQIETIENIEVLLHTEVRELLGEGSLEAVRVEQTETGQHRELDIGGLFVFVGADPCTEWLDGHLAKDDDGFLLTGGRMDVSHLEPGKPSQGRPALPLETSLPGVFAVGDGRVGSIKRGAAAVGEGDMSVRLVHEYLSM